MNNGRASVELQKGWVVSPTYHSQVFMMATVISYIQIC